MKTETHLNQEQIQIFLKAIGWWKDNQLTNIEAIQKSNVVPATDLTTLTLLSEEVSNINWSFTTVVSILKNYEQADNELSAWIESVGLSSDDLDKLNTYVQNAMAEYVKHIEQQQKMLIALYVGKKIENRAEENQAIFNEISRKYFMLGQIAGTWTKATMQAFAGC